MRPLPVALFSFEEILNIFGNLYEVIWTSAYLIWDWFSQPVDDSVVELLPAFAGQTNLEILLGTGLFVALTMSLAKRLMPF